jgi:superfamily II DNA or RNA helicase
VTASCQLSLGGHVAREAAAAKQVPALPLRPYQQEALDAITAAEGRGVNRAIVALPTGTGKAQPVDEPVLTPTGWRPIGDLEPSELVIGEHGDATKVLGVYPQGRRPIARVTFSDGASTRCDWEHLWAVETKTQRFENRSMRHGRTSPRSPRVLTLREIVAEGLRDQQGWRHFIPLASPILHDHLALPLHPYLLGVLLGDGGLSVPGQVRLHTQDDVAALVPLPAGAHLTRLSDAGGGASNYRIAGGRGRRANPSLDALRALGLHGLRSYEKFIPEAYLLGSPDDRHALLQGLLDTDRTIAGGSGAEYSTSSGRLARDVAALVRSLGGTCRTASKTPTYRHNGERRQGRTSYRLTIALPEGLNPFRVARKVDRWQPRSKYQPARAITAVEDAGEAACVCIQVEDDKQLYVTRDYVVTHNTVCFAHLIGRRPGRALVIAHRDELIQQAAGKLRQVAPSLEVGIVKAERDQAAADVVVASIQTLARPSRLARLERDFATIVVDECHHSSAETYVAVLRHFGVFDDHGPLCVGFTATPERADARALGAVWEEIVYQRGIVEMIAAGYLCDLRAIQVGTDADLSRLKVRHGDLQDAEIAEELLRSGAIGQVAGAYVKHAHDRKGLAFTPTVETAYALAEALVERGIRAEALDGTTPGEKRRSILARLASGQTQVCVNCSVLTEGFDEPSIQAVLVARPTRSRVLYAQMIGRGTRLHPGTTDCLVLDLAGVTARHDLATVAELADLDPAELDGKTLTEALVARQARDDEQEERGDGGGGEEKLRLPGITVQVPMFRSKMRWLQVGGCYVLPIGKHTTRTGEQLGEGHVYLVADGEAWRVEGRRRGRPAKLLAEGLSLEYAQGFGRTSRGASPAGSPARTLPGAPSPRPPSSSPR